MTALIIIVAVFAFIALLLLIPISAEVSFHDEFFAVIRYGGIKIFKSGKNKKTQGKPAGEDEASKKQEKSKPEKQGFIATVFKEKGKIAGLKFCFSLFELALKKIVWVLKRIKFKKFYLDISVASDDAAHTAIAYGALCAVAYPAVNLIERYSSFDIKKINIYTDFDKLSPEIEGSIQLKTRLIFALIAAVSLFFAYLKLKKESDKNG
ncbi:MAG: DUF2953 domain-containing protein [Clostridia bacterium]|nr:DUF2953 domain-containing protein [Clostridia bacterium]